MNSFLSLVLPTTLSSALVKIRPCLFSATHWNMPMSARFKLLIVRTPLFTWTLSCWRQKDTHACIKYLKWSEMKTAQQPDNKQVQRKFEEATEGSCLRCKICPSTFQGLHLIRTTIFVDGILVLHVLCTSTGVLLKPRRTWQHVSNGKISILTSIWYSKSARLKRFTVGRAILRDLINIHYRTIIKIKHIKLSADSFFTPPYTQYIVYKYI